MSNHLEAVASARKRQTELRQRIDAELRQQRTNRLMASDLEVQNAVINAYANGETIAAIQRAYGTKDYNTVRRLLDGREAEIEIIRAAAEEAAVEESKYPWKFTEDGQVIVKGAVLLDIIELDDGEDLLISVENSTDAELSTDEVEAIVELYDGRMESTVNAAEVDALFKAYRAR